MILFQMQVVPCSEKFRIWSYGSILDDAESQFWILRIILESAGQISTILEIQMKQLILFQMQVVPCSEKFRISSYGSILDDPESKFWILRIILESTGQISTILEIQMKQMVIFQLKVVRHSEIFWISSSGSYCAEKC